mgnify:CR=1 FL=1
MSWIQNSGCEYVYFSTRESIEGKDGYTACYLNCAQYLKFKNVIEKMGLDIKKDKRNYFQFPNSEEFEIDDFDEKVTFREDSHKSLRKILDEICGIKESVGGH